MKIINPRQMKVFYQKIDPDTGKLVKKMAKIGVKLEVDNVEVSYNFKRKTFSVKYPDRELTNRAGGKTGEVEKGQKFSGLTHKQMLKDFGPKFVQLVGEAIVRTVQES